MRWENEGREEQLTAVLRPRIMKERLEMYQTVLGKDFGYIDMLLLEEVRSLILLKEAVDELLLFLKKHELQIEIPDMEAQNPPEEFTGEYKL